MSSSAQTNGFEINAAQEAQELATKKAALTAFLASRYDGVGSVTRDALFTGYNEQGLDEWLEEQLDDALDDADPVACLQSLAATFDRLAWNVRYAVHESRPAKWSNRLSPEVMALIGTAQERHREDAQ
ncbi:MAG: hypothetical protein RLO08_13095 [Parvibaculaceae bacterium]